MAKCGCTPFTMGGEAFIDYCPKHAAAGGLLAALKDIIAYYDGNEVSANTIRERWLPEARAAIEAAEKPAARGGAPRSDAHGDLSGLGDDDCWQYTEEEENR